MNTIINPATKQIGVQFNRGETFPRDDKRFTHVANRSFFGTLFRIYHCGFVEGKRQLAIVNPRTWQVTATVEMRNMGIPSNI